MHLCLQVCQRRVTWLAKELHEKGVPDTKVLVLRAFQVYDETLADQFSILAGQLRGPVPIQ